MGPRPDYLGLNSESQKMGFSLEYFCFSKVLGALYGKELYRCLSVDSYIFDGLKSQRKN